MAEEKVFENKIKKYLSSIGAWYFKVWGGGYQSAGIPDLIICYKGRFIAVEVKREKGIVSKLQQMNINKINYAEGIAISLRPHQFDEFKKLMEEIK